MAVFSAPHVLQLDKGLQFGQGWRDGSAATGQAHSQNQKQDFSTDRNSRGKWEQPHWAYCTHMCVGLWSREPVRVGARRGRCAGVQYSDPTFFALDDRICSPPFMELTSLCGDDTMRLLEQNGLAFPFSTYTVGSGANITAVGGSSPHRSCRFVLA